MFPPSGSSWSICLLLIGLLSLPLSGQQSPSISGRVLDRATREPIPYASIYVEGAAIGTTTNAEGSYTFHLPTERDTGVIVVSSIGYSSWRGTPRQLAADSILYLDGGATRLAEAVITATRERQLSARQIVERAYTRIPENYPTRRHTLEGFIRDLQREDSSYVELLECAVRLYVPPYTVQREPRVELVAVRTHPIAERHPWNDGRDRQNSIIDLLEDDFIRFDYGPISSRGGWRYTLDTILPYDGRYVYRILGRDKPFQSAVLYIDTERFAFVRMELTRRAHRGRSWRRRLSSGQEQVYYHAVFEYRELGGKMYLHYQKEADTWNIYDVDQPKKLLLTKHPQKELFVNRVITDPAATDAASANLDIGRSVENQSGTYDAAFWSTYNAPRRTRALSAIEAELRAAGKD